MSMKEKISDIFQKIRHILNPKSEWDENPVYSSILNLSDGNPHRFHLRILNDYTGILTVDASFILYLNQTAAIYIQQWISGKELESIKEYFVEEFKIDGETITKDFESIKTNLENLLTQVDINPVQLGFHTIDASKRVHEIPLRVYLALTYKFNETGPSPYSSYSGDVESKGIYLQKSILEKLNEFGVPQVTLSGGEPTLKKGFDELIEYGEEKGIVMGLMTNGVLFQDNEQVKKVIQQGLDYVIIPFHTSDRSLYEKITGRKDLEEKIQAIVNFEQDDIYLETKTTLLNDTKDTILETIEYLYKELKVENIEVNGLINPPGNPSYENGIDVDEVKTIVKNLKIMSDEMGFNFSFTSPTSHPQFNPLDYELGLTNTHPANTSITIEPNGSVLPVQFYFHSPGNILKDRWSKIWYSPQFRKIRKKRINITGKEKDLLTFCGGGIPFNL